MEIPNDWGDESFADDLNMWPGIVSGRVALLLRSTEIQPAAAPICPLFLFCRGVLGHDPLSLESGAHSTRKLLATNTPPTPRKHACNTPARTSFLPLSPYRTSHAHAHPPGRMLKCTHEATCKHIGIREHNSMHTHKCTRPHSRRKVLSCEG